MARTTHETMPAEPRGNDGGDAVETTDLRRHRSVTTRRKLVDAMLGLLGEGVLRPTAEQVAARAEVGLRTVFRHFEDMPALQREALRVIEGMVEEVVRHPLAAPTWQARVLESVDLLAPHYEKLAVFYLATQTFRRESPYIDEQSRRFAAMQRQMLLGIVPAALANDPARFAALSLALSMDAWVHLRRDQSLEPAEAAAAMRAAVRALTRG
ncbi:TetR/AcrR family transcriptional regulator [Caldimonas sp. KR1-144]|uniref:TetR/AcrR family transcriptional regulator n=1 Tax=Caldimonas sp. KR1-144 TaxID=3400911 RepID=UPI003C094871